MHAAIQPDVVLQADPHVAAEQHGLSDHRHLHAADAEAGPGDARRQVVGHGLHGRGIGWRAPGNAQAQLDQRVFQQALLEQLLGEPQVAGVEDFQLGLHAQLGDAFGAGTQLRRSGDIDEVAVAEIQGAAVQGADFRQQLLDMRQALQRADQVGAGAELQRLLAATDFQVAAHAGGEVDDHVGVALADALDHLAVQRHVAARLAGLRIAHMAVGNGGAGLGCLDGGGGDFLGRDRDGRVFADGVASAGHRAGDDDFVVHGISILIRGERVPYAARGTRTAGDD